MKQKKKLISSILIPFEKKWVGLSPKGNQILASGVSLKEVYRKLDKLGKKNAIISFVLPFDKAYSP